MSNLKGILKRGGRIYGTLIVSTSPKWPEALANSGLDFVFIDTEHVPIDQETLSWMCRTYTALGLPAIVRIESWDSAAASKVVDMGACGVVAPYIETEEQAREFVGSVKYRPLKGKLRDSFLQDPELLEPKIRGYLEDYNSGVLAIVNIESVSAVENLDAILRVPELDAVLIGPHDLSVSMGIPEQYHISAFDEVVRRIIRKARDHNIAVGIHFWDGLEQEVEWAKTGANLIVHSGDIRLFSDGLQRDILKMREALGDENLDGVEDEGGKEKSTTSTRTGVV